MEQQAGRGWYDVGAGMAGMWDGERWTGERISHQQLQAMTAPPPTHREPMPPPPVVPPGPATHHRTGPPPQRTTFIVLGVAIAAIAALAGLGALQNRGVIPSPATTTTRDPFTEAAEIYQAAQPEQVESCCAALVVELGRAGEPITSGQATAFVRLLDRLGMPAGTSARMDGTRALDGTQSAEGEHARVTWTYHPDDGLRAVFEPA